MPHLDHFRRRFQLRLKMIIANYEAIPSDVENRSQSIEWRETRMTPPQQVAA
jgi:hypothetical protein